MNTDKPKFKVLLTRRLVRDIIESGTTTSPSPIQELNGHDEQVLQNREALKECPTPVPQESSTDSSGNKAVNQLAQPLDVIEEDTTLTPLAGKTNGHTELQSDDTSIECQIFMRKESSADLPGNNKAVNQLAQPLDVIEEDTTLTPLARETNGHTELQNGDTSTQCQTFVSQESSADSSGNNNQIYSFSVINFLAINGSVLFFCIDFFMDILLAKDYFDDGMVLECALTSSFVAGSFLVTGILSSVWYTEEKNRRNMCLIILTFPFATIERSIKYAVHGYKSMKKGSKENFTEMIYTGRDVCLLRMYDAFIESAPQLVLQIYLIFREQENLKNCEDIEVHSPIIRVLSVLSSWVSVSWSVTAYYRAVRISNALHKTHEEITLPASAGYFLWRAFEIGSRVLALVLMILINPIIFALIVFFHWSALVTWSFVTKTAPYEKLHENNIFIVCIGFVQVFSFMNITPDKSRYHALFYYIFFYIENIVILISWIVVKEESFCPWLYYGAIGIVSCGIVFTPVFIACYYKLCHPKTRIL